jgi:hypothetical protein
MSNRQEKLLLNQAKAVQFLEEKKLNKVEKRWEDAQVRAAGIQSVLDYAVEQYTQHKDEIDESAQKDIEEQIKARQKEIETFIMSEKELYLESIGIQED